MVLSGHTLPEMPPILMYGNGKMEAGNVDLPKEKSITLKVNGQNLVTLMCTPNRLMHLVVGFLLMEGVINNSSEINMVRVCDQEVEADVRLNFPFDCESFRAQQVRSSGCTGGIMSGNKKLNPIEDNTTSISVNSIFQLMKALYASAEDYQVTGGMHSSGLSLDGRELVSVAEDIGRHNTLDKIAGECLLKAIPTSGGILLTTGRISSEMVAKAARLQTPIVVSRTSPTSMAQALAQVLGITLVGYVRAGRFRVYTYPARIKITEECK